MKFKIRSSKQASKTEALGDKSVSTQQLNTASLLVINYALLLAVLLTACGNVSEAVVTEESIAQPVAEQSVQQTAIEQVQEVYKEVEGLFSSARLTLDSLEYECQNDAKGGQVNYYKHEGSIRLISNTYYSGDHFSWTEKYYLKDNKLFFSFVEENSWMFDSDVPEDINLDLGAPPTKDVIKEFRYYYNEEGAAIRCLEKEYVIRSYVELPVDPDKVDNQPSDCTRAKTIYEQYQRLVELKTVKELEAAVCL